MRGVDPGKHSVDLAECQTAPPALVELGNAVSNCMKRRGYTVLVEN
jgi:hypothetical protein